MNARDQLKRDLDGEPDVRAVVEHPLPPAFAELVSAYEATVGDRDRFLWKWLDHLLPDITLSCVDPDRREQVRLTKLVLTMFVVLLDDLAEKRRDRSTFEEAAKIPFDHQTVRTELPDVDVDFIEFAEHVWTRFEDELDKGRRVDGFESILRFDLELNLRAIDYASLSNQHLDVVNLQESIRYGAHNMMLLTYTDVDVMHASNFARGELASLRRIVVQAQEMMRIGNWIATWEREVTEGDFSSGVLVYALRNGIVTPEQLYEAREPSADHDWVIERIAGRGVERPFVDKYEEMRAELDYLGGEFTTVDIDDYLEGIERAMTFYLGTRRRL